MQLENVTWGQLVRQAPKNNKQNSTRRRNWRNPRSDCKVGVEGLTISRMTFRWTRPWEVGEVDKTPHHTWLLNSGAGQLWALYGRYGRVWRLALSSKPIFRARWKARSHIKKDHQKEGLVEKLRRETEYAERKSDEPKDRYGENDKIEKEFRSI